MDKSLFVHPERILRILFRFLLKEYPQNHFMGVILFIK